MGLELVIGAIAVIATVGTAILHISSSESNSSSITDIPEKSNDPLKDQVEFFLLKKLLDGIVTIKSKISSSRANEKQEQQERIESIASTLEGTVASETINIAQDIIEQLNDANSFDSAAETIASGVNDVTADYSTHEDAAASFQAEQQNGTWIETVPAYEQEPWTETYPAPENTEPQIESFPATQDEAPTITVFPDAKPEIPSIETIPAERPKELGDNILWNSGNKGVSQAEENVKQLYPRGDAPEYEICIKQDKIALKTYENLRETGLDENELKTFSENTGLDIETATKLKEHIFLTEHQNLVNYETKTYYSGYFEPNINIAYGWEKALTGELTDSEKAWFEQLAKHELAESELMKQGYPYRTVESIDSNGMSTGNPPGAHDLAPEPPGDFPGFSPKF